MESKSFRGSLGELKVPRGTKLDFGLYDTIKWQSTWFVLLSGLRRSRKSIGFL